VSDWKYVRRKDHGYFTFAEVVCGTRLKVTQIHQVVEYTPAACFQKFGDNISEARLDEIAADLMLLTVNDVCVSLFVGDCFPIAGISIKLAGLGHYGCFVYQYAKFRMLEFYYDFMDVFVDRSDFQYCAMDTDSAYMALSATSLEEVIKPDMQQRFQMEKKNWFPRPSSFL
jgi:hypothetical protein